MTTKTTSHTLRLTRTVAASPQRVFDAWTRPEHLKQWSAPEGYDVTQAEVDLKVGGKYRIEMRSPEGAQHTAVGTYREITSPSKLVYTWSWEDGPDGGDTLVTVEFLDRDGHTEVVLVHDLFPTDEARADHEQGWTSCLNRLVAVVERR
jgi:glutathione S-transferase